MDDPSTQRMRNPGWHDTFAYQVVNQTRDGFDVQTTRTDVDVVYHSTGWGQNLLLWWQADEEVDIGDVDGPFKCDAR